MYFRDRADAGRELASKLIQYRDHRDLLVLGLPRGGVPVAFEVAQALRAPLDVFIVRKLGVPGQEELAIGAVASGNTRVLNKDVVTGLQIPDHVIDKIAAKQQAELERLEQAYRGRRAPPDVRNKTVILVDDGLATGSSMRAAVQSVRQQQPARIVVAVPTAAPQTCDEFRHEVDEIVCAITPEPFYGVGMWYQNFSQTTDEEVQDLLARSLTSSSAAPGQVR
jgi:predicted phosphoribosyltransferase